MPKSTRDDPTILPNCEPDYIRASLAARCSAAGDFAALATYDRLRRENYAARVKFGGKPNADNMDRLANVAFKEELDRMAALLD